MPWLRSLLQKTHLIVVEAAPEAAQDGAQTRPGPLQRREVTLAQLIHEQREQRIAQAQERLQATLGLTADPEQVCTAAGIVPPTHGWTVTAVTRFLRQPERASLDASRQQRELLTQLAVAQVPPEDVIADARRRDEAIDAYDRFLKTKVDSAVGSLDQQICEIDRQLAGLRAQRDELAQQRKGMRETLRSWRQTKREHEQVWTDALRLLTHEAVVSIDDYPEEPEP